MTILQRVKTLLGLATLDISKDAILNILIEDSTQEFLNYTNCVTAPLTADTTISQMVIYKYNRQGSEGLASTSYSGISESYLTDYPDNLIKQMNKYRRLKVL